MIESNYWTRVLYSSSLQPPYIPTTSMSVSLWQISEAYKLGFAYW
ncbi:hypothetical protein [Paenibacillus nanensis]|nr:hypothetical protein [Paenibacillus nanensis]